MSLLQSATSGLGYLVGLQIASRAANFAFNVLVARSLGPAVFGIATVQLELLLQTALFLSKEAFARTCLQSKVSAEGLRGSGGQHHLKAMMNVAWLSLPVTCLVSLATSLVFLRRAPDLPESVSERDLTITVVLYGLSALVQGLGEPVGMLLQNLLAFRTQVAAEGIALFVRCGVAFTLAQSGFGLLAIGYAQLAYALCLTAALYVFVRDPGRVPADLDGADLLPGPFDGGAWIDWSLMRTLFSFVTASAGKYLLTQGERLVMTVGITLGPLEQGAYGLVEGLGSLVPRFLFYPLEMTANTLFSKLLQGERSDEKVKEAENVLRHLLHVVLLVGAVFSSFGPSYSYFLVRLLYGEDWAQSSAPAMLATYCYYLLLLGCNGSLEAFFYAAASDAARLRYTAFQGIATAVQAAIAIIAGNTYGGAGLLWGSCAGMLLRILYCLRFADNYFTTGLREFLPSSPVLVVLAATAVASRLSEQHLGQFAFTHLAAGVLAFGACCAAIAYCEKPRLLQMRALYRHGGRAE